MEINNAEITPKLRKKNYKMQKMSYKTQKNIILVTFLAIPIILLVLFLIYPSFRLFYMSFTDWDGVLANKNFVGFGNYKRIFSMPKVWLSLRNNLYYIFNGFLQNIIALLFAVLLNTKMRGRNIFKVLIFITYIINSAAVGYMFNYIYDYEKGPLNALIASLGMEPVHFLTHPILVNVSIAAVCLWRYTGYTMVLYIAALQSVNTDIYEASMVDGANSWQRFRFITIPSIIRIVELNMFLCLSGGLKAFDEAFVMTKGGPADYSSTFLIYINQAAFQFDSYGLSAALSFTLLLIIIVVTVVQRKVVFRGGGDDI